MSASTAARRPLGADRLVALLVILVSLPTIGWLVASDQAAANPAPLTAATSTSDMAARPVADEGLAPMHSGMHASADHEPMHPEMHAGAAGGPAPSADAPASPTDTEAAATDADPVAAGTTTVVRMDEFSFAMPTRFAAGTHTFEVVNDGLAPHEFALGAVGDHNGHLGQTDWLEGGESARVTVELEPGTYEVGCHVPGHYEAGMTTTVTVTD